MSGHATDPHLPIENGFQVNDLFCPIVELDANGIVADDFKICDPI